MQRHLAATLCALLTLAPAPAAAAPLVPQDGAKVTEPKTDVVFPVTRTAEDGKTKLTLAGTALRDKRVILNFKVYAYGFYVDPAGAKKALAPFKGKSHKSLTKSDEFYAALLKDDFAKSLRLVFVRDVDGDDVEGAFSDSIEPRAKKARDKRKMPDATAAIRTFKSFFQVDELAEGDEVIFTWLPGGKLETTVKGKRKKQIVSPTLCWALFDIYLGERPIEDKGKKTMVERIPALLR